MSTAVALLTRLRAAGVILSRSGSALRYDAPLGVLTPALLAELRQHKAEVLELLREPTRRSRKARAPEKAAAPDFDEAAYTQLWRDIATTVEDLADEGGRPGRIARMFGLRPGEVVSILRGSGR